MIPSTPIESPRLLLRAWHPDDAPALHLALERSWDDLQRWIPWVFGELEDEGALRKRLETYRTDFLGGRNALYGIFGSGGTELWGGVGLYRRVGPDAVEIGYWIRSDVAGRGIATEASALLVAEAFALDGIQHVEIRCDPTHGASAAIPRKLGFVHRETLAGEAGGSDGKERDTAVWALGAEEYRTRK